MTLKNTIIGLATGALLMFGSCTDLSETIYSQLSDDNIDDRDPASVEAFMGKVFAQLRAVYWSWNGYFDLMEECTDVYMTPLRLGVGWGNMYIPMHKHSWNKETEHVNNFWNRTYVGIMYANKCVDVFPETGYNQAQVRFVRALYYYTLFDAFRSVPLETTQNIEPGYLPVKKPEQEVYDFCVSELIAIKGDLGTEKVFGYANRYAACMLLAKLYLNHSAYFRTSGNEYYEKALAEVNEVINDGGYKLAPHYLDNFRQNIDGSPEVIFAVPLDPVSASVNYLSNKALIGAGAPAFGLSSTPWNGSAGVPQFMDTYDEDDKRFEWSWTGGVQRYATVVNGVTIPNSGEPIPFTPDDWTGEGFLNYNKNVHSIDNPGAYQQEGYRFIKSEIVAGSFGTYGNDLCYFRLADAMFIKAECLLRLGRDEQTAADLITEVRMRSFDSPEKARRTIEDLKGGSVYDYGHREYTCVGAANWDPASFIATYEGGDDIILGGLLDDLAWEFVGEHHRRQDLIRFRMTDGRNVFNGKSWFCKDATHETHWDYFPISRQALQANILLEQSEGYD